MTVIALAPFVRNVIPASNMHRSTPDPSWDIGEEQKINMKRLRAAFLLLNQQASAMTHVAIRRRLNNVCSSIDAMVRMAAADNAPDAIYELGVAVLHHLLQMAARLDDMIFTLDMHEPADIAEQAEAYELQLAMLMHCHLAAQEQSA